LGDEVLLPTGYEGWFLVEYEVSGEPALKIAHCKYLITVPESGIVKTSSGRKEGYGIDKYYFVRPDGTRHEIPVDYGTCSVTDICVLKTEYYWGPSRTDAFLVGSKSQIERYPMPKLPDRIPNRIPKW
jgi:hypothetical protein